MSPNSNGQPPIFPRPHSISAGLPEAIFRQTRSLGQFADWRLSLLAAIGGRSALDGWRARDPQDLGVMLVEMGAYLADVVSFYDALVANESYLRTATLPGGRRSLVSLLGYYPRPAVASEVLLAAHADGVKPVTLPPGTAFRSGEFLDDALRKQAPQVFELLKPATVDPRINRLAIQPVRQTAMTGSFDRLLVDPAFVRVRAGEPVVLSFNGTLRTARVEAVRPMLSLRKEMRAAELHFSQQITPPDGATYAGLRVLAPGNSTMLWQHDVRGSDTKHAIDGNELLLGSQIALRAGEVLLFEKEGMLEARHATSVTTVQRVLLTALSSQVKDISGTVERTLVSPEIRVGVTGLSLGRALPWTSADVGKITVYHGLIDAARVVAPLEDTLNQGDPVVIPDLLDPPRVTPGSMLLADVHGAGEEVHGTLDAAGNIANLDMTPAWGRSLTPPVSLYGNVLKVSRGESVTDELLGLGNATLATQTFKLQKKPLTYLNAATASGLASSLSIRVAGVLWQEVPSFYGRSAMEEIFIVRHDDEGESYITFGGGARVPTNARIVADYRFGAGAAQPPAGSVSQLAKPVAGLKQVRNLLPAFGGEDAESSLELATKAPRSALLLGRAVSLVDLQHAAAVPGVKAARATWCWDAAGLRPAAVIRYIGDPQLLPLIQAKLSELSEPDAAISVVRAEPQTASLSLQLVVDSRYDGDDVVARAMVPLYGPVTVPGSGGMLRPERLGPDGSIFLSRIAEAIMGVEGVAGLQTVTFNGAAFTEADMAPVTGRYWSFGEPGMAGFGIQISRGKL